MDIFWGLMAIVSLVFAIAVPYWWGTLIGLICAWQYLKMATEI